MACMLSICEYEQNDKSMLSGLLYSLKVVSLERVVFLYELMFAIIYVLECILISGYGRHRRC